VWTVLMALIVSVFAVIPAVQPGGCPQAPDPRLRPGMAAVVAPGLWGLNLRALPAVSTGVRAQIGAGQRMTVLTGPACNGAYQWWQVELPNGVRGWVAEGAWTGAYLVPATADGQPRALISPLEWSCPGWRSARRCPLP
jgi:hypothetical protein